MASLPEQLTYGQVRDLFGRIKSDLPEFEQFDLPQFSQLLNETTESQIADQGLSDNIFKRYSYGLDKALRPIGKHTEELSARLAQGLGLGAYEDIARSVGAELPRGLIETAAVFTPGGWATKAGLIPKVLGAGSAATKGYTETGSPAVGAVQGGLTALLPKFVEMGGRAATAPLQRMMYPELLGPNLPGQATQFVTQRVPGYSGALMENLVEEAGRNVGATINQELAIQGSSVAMGGGLRGYDREHSAELIAGTVPFALLDVARVLPRGITDATGQRQGPRSSMEARGIQQAAKAATEVESYLKTRDQQLDEITAAGVTAKGAIDEAKQANFLRRHLQNRLNLARKEGRPLDIMNDVGQFDPFPDGRKGRRATADEMNKLDTMVQDLIKRDILAQDDKGKLLINGEVDLSTAFKGDWQREIGLPEAPTPANMAFPGFKATGQHVYYIGKSPETGMVNFPPPAGPKYLPGAEPMPYGWVRPELPQTYGEMKAWADARVPLEKKNEYEMLPAWPDEPTTVAEVKPFLELVWKRFAQVAGEDASKPPVRKTTERKMEFEEPVPGVEGVSITRDKPVTKSTYVLSRELPTEVRDFYNQMERIILDRFGVATLKDLDALPPTMVPLRTAQIDPRLDLFHFREQVRQLFPGDPDTQATLLKVEPTLGEKFEYAKSLALAVRQMIVRSTTSRATKSEKQVAGLAREIGKPKLESAAETIESRGKHGWISKLLQHIENKHQERVRELSEQLDLVAPDELARRRYNLEMRHLAALMEAKDVLDGGFERTVGDVVGEARIANDSLLAGKKVSRAEETATFVTLDEMSKGAVPWGEAVISAVAKLERDVTVANEQVTWVARHRREGGLQFGGSDLLSDFGFYLTFKKAAKLADPVHWAKVKSEQQQKSNRTLTDEEIAWRHLAKAKRSEVEFSQAAKMAFLYETIKTEVADQHGVDFDPQNIDFTSGRTLKFLQDPDVLESIADKVEILESTARSFPPGSPADQMLNTVRIALMEVSSEQRDVTWWKQARKAKMRFHPDGTVDWDNTKFIESARERVLPEMVEKWNKIIETLLDPETPLVVTLKANGELGVRIVGDQYGSGENPMTKLNLLERMGAIPEEKINELHKLRPVYDDILTDVKNRHPNVTDESQIIGITEAELRKALGKWGREVDNSFTNWQFKHLPVMLERLQGLAFKQWEPPTPQNMAYNEVRPMPGSVKDSGESMQKLITGLYRADVDQPINSMRLMAGAKTFFENRWRNMGLSPELSKMYTDVALRVTAAFEQIGHGKIAETTEYVVGQYIGLGYRRYIVGMGSQEYVKRVSDNPAEQATYLISTMAHELSHRLFDPNQNTGLGWDSDVMVKFINEWAAGLAPEDRRMLVETWWDTVVPLNDPRSVDRGQLAYDSPQEFIADLGSMMVMGMTRPDVETAAKVKAIGYQGLWGDPHVHNLMKMLFVPLTEIGDALTDLYRQVKVSEPGIAKARDIMDAMKKVINTNEQKIQAALDGFNKLEMFDRANYERLMAEGYSAEPYSLDRFSDLWYEMFHESKEFKKVFRGETPRIANMELGLTNRAAMERNYGIRPNFFERNFMLPAFLVRRFPMLRPVIDIVFRYHGMVNDNAVQIGQAFMTQTKYLRRKVLDLEGTGLNYIFTHPEAGEATSTIGLFMQEFRRMLTPDEMKSIMLDKGVRDPNHQQKIMDFFDAVKETSPRIRDTIIKGLRTRINRLASMQMMLGDKTMRMDQAKLLGGEVEKSMWALMTSVDPNERDLAQATLAGLTQVNPKVAKTAAFVKPILQTIKEFADRTQGQPWYMSEMRLGKHMVAWREKTPSKFGSRGFDTVEQLDAFVKTLRDREASGEIGNIRTWLKDDRQKAFSGMHPDFIKTLQTIERASLARGMAEAGIPDDHAQQLLAVYEPMEASLRETEESGAGRFLRERKLAPGREGLNMARGYITHIESVSRSLAKAVVKGDVALAMMDPELQANPALQNIARDHFNNVVNPSGKEFGFMKRVIFSYFMGFNISSMLIEGTQPMLMLAPLITRDTNNIATSYKFIGKAVGSLVHRLNNKGSFGDAVLDRAFQRALDEQVLDFGVTQEFREAEGLATVNIRTLLQGGEGAYNPATWAKTLLDSYARFGRHFYSFAPRMNSMISFISLFRVAREHGVMQNGKRVKLNEEQAYEYAKLATRAATLGGGVAGRPVGLFSQMGKAQGVVGLGYSLGTYTFGMVSHLARLGLDSIDQSGLPPADKVAARKALGQTLMTQVGLAGAMGIPLAGAAMAVLEQWFPTLEVRKTIEDTISQMVGEDEEGGGVWTDTIMRGAPFAQGGIDLSSRLELSQLMGLSPYDGFSLANLLGPSGSVLENMYRAVQEGSEGRFGEAGETLLPTAWKNVVKLWRDDWKVKDQSGRTLLEPTESELAWDMLGFRPKRLVAVRNARRLAKRGDEVWKLKNQLFHEEMAKHFIAGDTEKVREGLLSREREIKGYNAVAGARSIVDEVMQRTLPYDFAREGIRVNAPARQRLAQQAGVQQIPETQRVQIKSQIGAQIGIPGAGAISSTEMRLAAVIDHLMQTNPMLSRQEAYEQAVLVLGGQQRPLQAPPIP